MALPQPTDMMHGMTLAPPDHEAIAAEALAAMDGARQIAPFSARHPGLTLEDEPACVNCERRAANA
jgi:2-keto-4-pentenoate hydratase